MRIGAPCSSRVTTAGVAKSTGAPAARPNSSTAEIPKTKASETPFASTPSSGTGNRSASREAASSAETPSSVVAECSLVANDAAAATVVANPAAQTGRTTGKTRPVAASSAVTRLLPLENVEIRTADGDRDHHGGNQQEQQPGAVPLEHRTFLPR